MVIVKMRLLRHLQICLRTQLQRLHRVVQTTIPMCSIVSLSSSTGWTTHLLVLTGARIQLQHIQAVNAPVVDELTGGTDDYAVTAGELEIAYDKFADTESLDINLVLGGPSSAVADTKTAQDTHVTMITELC